MLTLDIDEKFEVYEAFGLPKNSEFKGIFDYNIVKLRQSGILEQIRSIHFQNRRPDMNDEKANDAIVLGYTNLLFPFIILAGGNRIGSVFSLAP